MNIGYIILGLFLAVVILGGGTYLGVFLKRRKQWVWPEGKRITSLAGPYTCNLVYDKESAAAFKYAPQAQADRCAEAAILVAEAAKIVGVSGEVPTNFVVHVVNSKTYDKIYDSLGSVRSNGMSLDMSAKMGGETMPLLACRLEGFIGTEDNGELVIHELVHALAGNGAHSDPKLWGYPDGIEGRAVAEFSKRFGST